MTNPGMNTKEAAKEAAKDAEIVGFHATPETLPASPPGADLGAVGVPGTREASSPRRVEEPSQASRDCEELGVEDEGFKPLTREEAQRLLAANPAVSPWKMVGYQVMTGIAVAVLAWMLTGQLRMAWSAGYGALAVVIPAALFVRGLMRQRATRHGGAALVGFFVWEMVKIVLTVAMLVAAPRLVAELSWLALLAGFVVTMKVYWVAMWFRLAPQPSVKNI